MPKKISEVAMIIRCREIDAAPSSKNQFPSSIWEDPETGLLTNDMRPEMCRFTDPVAAMTQNAMSGDIIVCRSGSYLVSDHDGEISPGLNPGVVTEPGFIVRPLQGSRFYFRYLSWFGNGPGLRMLRKEIAAKTLLMPDYTEQNERRIDAAEQAVADAEEALASAQHTHIEARQAVDTAWSEITR